MLSIQAQTSDFPKSKLPQIFIKERLPYSLDDLDHTDITAEIDGITEIVPSLTFIIVEVIDLKFINLYLAPIFVHHIWFYLSRIQTDGSRNSLKDTSRLIG